MEIRPPCDKQEYYNFVKRQIEPSMCTPMKIYRFQADVLRLIYDSPRIAERIEVEYCLSH